jgi:hypothetical protein
MHNGTTRPIAIRGWIVFYASIIHLTWALCLFLSPDAIEVAPVNKVADWLNFNQYAAGTSYLVAGVFAWWGGTRHKYDIFGLILGLPQLLLILMGTQACLEIIIDGVHPDGTRAHHGFFFAQLAGSLWLAPVYMLAVYMPYWKAMWRQRKL